MLRERDAMPQIRVRPPLGLLLPSGRLRLK